jgi:hypothetical protein
MNDDIDRCIPLTVEEEFGILEALVELETSQGIPLIDAIKGVRSLRPLNEERS